MVTLVTCRHYHRYQRGYETVEKAARAALMDLEYETAWPIKVVDESGRMLWMHDGPLGWTSFTLWLLVGPDVPLGLAMSCPVWDKVAGQQRGVQS